MFRQFKSDDVNYEKLIKMQSEQSMLQKGSSNFIKSQERTRQKVKSMNKKTRNFL